MNFSKKIVALVIFLNVAYTVAALYVFLKTSGEPVVLTAAVFAFTTGEVWLLAGIKKRKQVLEQEVLEQQRDEREENNDE